MARKKMMQKEKNNVKFKDLFSDYEHRKSLKDKESKSNPNISEKSQSKELLSPSIANAWGFLKSPLENLTNKEENKASSLKFLNEYKDLYKIFKVFQRDDIKINYRKIMEKTLMAGSSIMMFVICLGIFVAPLLSISAGLAYLAGLMLFYQKSNDLNGINEEILYRKYKTFLSLMLFIKPHIRSEDDLQKLMAVMSKNTDVEMPDELRVKYSAMVWGYLSKVDEDTIKDIHSLNENDLIGVLYANFKKLLENRNSDNKTSKDWDNIVEIFTHEKIDRDLQTLDNIDLLNKNN